MEVSISARPDATAALDRLHAALDDIPARVIACSGGIDSLVLATVAHRAAPAETTVAHTMTPAVPGDGTARVIETGRREGWNVELVRSREFDDERYLSNPADRCYFCKSNLYDAIDDVAAGLGKGDAVTILSGANLDDLGEYRPGLTAASEHGVRHPFVEANIGKLDIRAIARLLDMTEADLPASPCLASRLYTGTRVTPSRLAAVEAGEALVRRLVGIDVVRCRVDASEQRGDALHVMIEVIDTERALVDAAVVDEVAAVMRNLEPTIVDVKLDDRPYESGRAFVHPVA